MPAYRRKPPIVQAEQWFPGKNIPGVIDRNGRPLLSTRGGTIEGKPGDWIVDEGFGVRYPVDPVDFVELFEVVPGPVLQVSPTPPGTVFINGKEVRPIRPGWSPDPMDLPEDYQ